MSQPKKLHGRQYLGKKEKKLQGTTLALVADNEPAHAVLTERDGVFSRFDADESKSCADVGCLHTAYGSYSEFALRCRR